MAGKVAELSRYPEPGTIVTDAGSTKQDVITAAHSNLAERLKNFVPAHPIAGAEQGGASAVDAYLFRGKNLVFLLNTGQIRSDARKL